MYRQSSGKGVGGGDGYFSHINHWLCAEKPARCSSSILRPSVPLLMNAQARMGKDSKCFYLKKNRFG